MRLIALALLLAACDPTLPSGSYRCSAIDQSCPGDQHCTCGLCVVHDDEAACSFDITVAGAAPQLSVREHQPFDITVVARAKDGNVATGFDGTVDLGFRLPDGTRWADVRPGTIKLATGRRSSPSRSTARPSRPRRRT